MTNLPDSDSDLERRVRVSFARQKVMELIGATVSRVGPGSVELILPFRDDLTQQHGYIHAGVITTIADSACGYAAFTMMPESSEVLSVEFKTNLLRPAKGQKFIASARVLKSGRTLTVVKCDVFADVADETKLIATMLGTMICR